MEKNPFISRNHQEVTNNIIKEITYPNGKILFDYITNDEEFSGGKILKNVKFYQNNKLYKNYILDSKFTTSTTSSKIKPQYNNENLSKRLFLFEVSENLTNIKYMFDYYGVNKSSLKTDFPSRFSGKEDYWGSYSSRGDFLPYSNYYIDEHGKKVQYDGANKNPILNDAVIGSLKSIQLPTGGFQEVEYELDDFRDEGYIEEYFEEKAYGAVSHTGETVSITIDEVEKMYNSKLYFDYEGINTVDFDESTMSLPTVQHYYVNVLINGKHWKTLFKKGPFEFVFSPFVPNSVDGLNRGDILTFEFIRGNGFKNKISPPLSLDLRYSILKKKEIPFVYRKTGNLRMKELILKEGFNTTIYKKEYTYKKFDKPNESSGYFLGRDMNMNYYTRRPYNNPAFSNGSTDYCEYLNVSSQNNFNLYALENKSVVYPNVTEKIINTSDNSFHIIEREFSTPNKRAYSEFQLPFIQGPYNGYMGGLLENAKYKDEKGNVIKYISNLYSFDNYFNKISSEYDEFLPKAIYPAMDLSVRSLFKNRFQFDVNTYYYPSTWIKLIETKETIFLKNNNFVQQIKSFSYNYNHIKPIRETTTNSKGETLTTEYQYPPDWKDNPIAQRLTAENRIAEPLTVVQKNGSNNVISAIYNEYNDFSGILQKSRVFQKKGNDKSAEGDDVITYNSYDNKGNITQYTPKNGIPVSIIWGYNGQYPIAKIEGVSYTDISSFVTTLENASNGGTLTKDSFTNLRNALPKAMITTYIYQPLVGVTRIIQPNGQTEYYKYDDAGRLQEIKNDKGEVLKTFEYNYKN